MPRLLVFSATKAVDERGLRSMSAMAMGIGGSLSLANSFSHVGIGKCAADVLELLVMGRSSGLWCCWCPVSRLVVDVVEVDEKRGDEENVREAPTLLLSSPPVE